jgi:hypothetical protein
MSSDVRFENHGLGQHYLIRERKRRMYVIKYIFPK